MRPRPPIVATALSVPGMRPADVTLVTCAWPTRTPDTPNSLPLPRPWPRRGRGSAVTDGRARVTPGVEVEARHVAVQRLHDVVPDAVPKDRTANGKTVHRHRAAGRAEQDDRRGGGTRRRPHMQAVGQRVVHVLVPVPGAGGDARGRVTPGVEVEARHVARQRLHDVVPD